MTGVTGCGGGYPSSQPMTCFKKDEEMTGRSFNKLIRAECGSGSATRQRLQNVRLSPPDGMPRLHRICVVMCKTAGVTDLWRAPANFSRHER
ncbi:hypothetical protein E2C01_031268 [Portunus trituberculatus]|uniref:Uncharacterized protein n=1 Tax=Portunus trituberculatus TaxID=210409 RepID=A0A5B7EX78_PORTR|nr:hypothetical protein [Portunus trituberculatus]